MQNFMGNRVHILFCLGKRTDTVGILKNLQDLSKSDSKPDYILYTDSAFVCRDFKNTSYDAKFHGLSNAYLVLSWQTKSHDQYR